MKKILLFLFLVSCAPGTRYTLHEANDFFSPVKNEDRDFTQGLRFAAEVPKVDGSTSYYVGQQFYTPGNKQLKELQKDDRPYAGYLYGGADFKFTCNERVQEIFGVTLGVVGEHSYSGETQNEFHRLLGQKTAKGWDNQLKDELGVIVTYEQNVVNYINKNNDWIITTGVNSGNVYTQSYSGFLYRTGINLPSYFSTPQPFRPRLDSREKSYSETAQYYSVYLFFGPRLRAVLRNIFLDGNSFTESHSIDKKYLVAEGNLGLAFEYGLYRLVYTWVIQTAEFKGQPNGNSFGEVTLSVGW